jgi:hypothetical protein
VPDIHSTHWASIEKLEMLKIIATVIARWSINNGNNLEPPEDLFKTTAAGLRRRVRLWLCHDVEAVCSLYKM